VMDLIDNFAGSALALLKEVAEMYTQRIPTPDAERILRDQLLDLETPRRKDEVSPITGSGPPDQARLKIIEEVSSVIGSSPERLLVEEANQAGKSGTKSIYEGYRGDTQSRFPSLESLVQPYFTPRPARYLNTRAAKIADAAILSYFSSEKLLTPASLISVCVGKTKKSGAGFPDFLSMREPSEEVFSDAYRLAEAGYPLSFAGRYPGNLNTRLDSRGIGMPAKPRAIFGIALRDNIGAKQLWIPLLDRMRSYPTFSALVGMHAVDWAVTRLLDSRVGGPIWSVDFSRFDVNLPFEVIDRVFGIMCRIFSPEAHPLIRFQQATFKGTGLLTPGTYYPGACRSGGVPSGSGLTSWMGCMGNLWAVHYIVALLKGRVDHALVMGDDGLYRFTGVSVREVTDALSKRLGMIVSPDKVFESTDEAHYLQMVHLKSLRGPDGLCHGVRPCQRIAARMVSREQQVPPGWRREWDTLRYMQQINDGRHHPAFRKFAEWYVERDKHWIIKVMTQLELKGQPYLEEASSALGVQDDSSFKITGLLQSAIVLVLREILTK